MALYETCLLVGHTVPKSVDKVTLSLTMFPLDVLCDVVPFCEHVNELECEYLKDPKQVCIYMQYNTFATSFQALHFMPLYFMPLHFSFVLYHFS